jgi:hypothetical protein
MNKPEAYLDHDKGGKACKGDGKPDIGFTVAVCKGNPDADPGKENHQTQKNEH